MSARMRLRRADGSIYLDRWGIEWPTKTESTEEHAERRPLFGMFLHRMDAADPGLDLHDHPWWFGSLILWGGYTEERATTREAPARAFSAEPPSLLERIRRLKRGSGQDRCVCQSLDPTTHTHYQNRDDYPCARCKCARYEPLVSIERQPAGDLVHRQWLSWRTMRLDQCHRIVGLHRTPVWTLVIHGPSRRGWGFYLPTGWMAWRIYDNTVRAERRDMWAEISNDSPTLVTSTRTCHTPAHSAPS